MCSEGGEKASCFCVTCTPPSVSLACWYEYVVVVEYNLGTATALGTNPGVLAVRTSRPRTLLEVRSAEKLIVLVALALV